MARSKGTPILLHILRELERLGYQATAGIFSAAEVGLSHHRRRVFILGNANGGKRSIQFKSKLLLKESQQKEATRLKWGNPTPSLKGQKQSDFEPPRRSPSGQPTMGGLLDGSSDRLELSIFYTTCESMTDELRSLGNGVVPQTAAKAFEVLSKRLLRQSNP